MDVAKIIIPSICFHCKLTWAFINLAFGISFMKHLMSPYLKPILKYWLKNGIWKGLRKKLFSYILCHNEYGVQHPNDDFFFFLLIKKIPKNSNWSIKCFLIFFYFMKRTRKILIKRLFQSFPKTGRFSKIKVSQVLTSLMHYTKK